MLVTSHRSTLRHVSLCWRPPILPKPPDPLFPAIPWGKKICACTSKSCLSAASPCSRTSLKLWLPPGYLQLGEMQRQPTGLHNAPNPKILGKNRIQAFFPPPQLARKGQGWWGQSRAKLGVPTAGGKPHVCSVEAGLWGLASRAGAAPQHKPSASLDFLPNQHPQTSPWSFTETTY